MSDGGERRGLDRRHSACLGLGSNHMAGLQISRAVDEVGRGMRVERVSSVWESAAVGPPAPDYANAALLVETILSLDDLRARLREIENALGRRRGETAVVDIDIDVLVYDDHVVEPGLWDRVHLSVPVSELLPCLVSPTTGETLSAAARRLAAATTIRRVGDGPAPRSAAVPSLSAS